MGDCDSRNSLDFPPDARVRKRWEFLRIYDRGRLIKRPGLRVFVTTVRDVADASVVTPEIADDARPRLGLAATRKTGNAVVRNRLKRVTRELFRNSAPQMRPGTITVINFLSSSATMDTPTLRRHLLSAWRDGGMFSDAKSDEPPHGDSHGSGASGA